MTRPRLLDLFCGAGACGPDPFCAYAEHIGGFLLDHIRGEAA